MARKLLSARGIVAAALGASALAFGVFRVIRRLPTAVRARQSAPWTKTCPTGSIGTVSRENARPGIAAFPEVVAENVSFCGFTSKDSFGAWSYLIERPQGNVLVDSPRFAAPSCPTSSAKRRSACAGLRAWPLRSSGATR